MFASSFRCFKQAGLFSGSALLLIDEQTPECERNVLSKQRHCTQLCLRWVGRPEESFHTSRQKKVLTAVRERVRVCASARASPTPAHPDYLATSVLVVSLGVDTLTHSETLKSKQPHGDFLILCCHIETLNVLQSSLKVCLH